MKAPPTGETAAIPILRWTPVLYRAILRVTKRHGMFTIARNHVRRYPSGQIIRTPGGGRMFIPPDPHFIGFLTSLHEEHITRILRDVIEPGSLCLDVGANIGYFTVMMSSLSGSTGCVYAFEPESGNFAVLSANASMTTKNDAPIIARNEAVSNECGSVNLVVGEESTLHQVSKSGENESSGISVKSISIDSLLKEIGSRKVKLLKVDVEGHELPALKGAQNLISAGLIENLIIEVTPGDDAEYLVQLLAPHARSIRSWVNGEWIEMPMSDLQIRTDVWVRF